uniref:DUF4283 domain-containing protein n=1 Tax=Nicotiana tabacum TaxID=4097 RepID=A0A1S3Y0S8_TOBAC|nr:PREDICTED: uncharacterized protein LOC107770762 [Nicotiana tabacum]
MTDTFSVCKFHVWLVDVCVRSKPIDLVVRTGRDDNVSIKGYLHDKLGRGCPNYSHPLSVHYNRWLPHKLCSAPRTTSMAPSNGGQPARIDTQNDATVCANNPTESIAKISSYATAITTATPLPPPKIRHPREAVSARHTTHNGMPAVIFKATDYYGVMAKECRLTIMGRFLKPRPRIEKIRATFREQFSVKGRAKIGVYDNYNVFLDFTNEDDFNSIWYRRMVEIDGLQMWLQKWTQTSDQTKTFPLCRSFDDHLGV